MEGISRSSCSAVFLKKANLKTFKNYIAALPWWSSINKNKTLSQMLSCAICEILNNSHLEEMITDEHWRTAAVC